jgi:hypothetical protein
MVGLEVLGVREVTDLFAEVNHELKDGLKDRLRQATKLVRTAAADETDSRRMKSALTIKVVVDSLIEFLGVIFPRGKWAFIGRFLEGGTKPHIIDNFHGREGVAWPHPGSRPHPFLRPALEKTTDQVVELVGIPPVLR